jgi:hypothetical protein
MAKQQRRIWLKQLFAYASEFNPLEYICGHWTKLELPTFVRKDYFQLSSQARKALAWMHRRRL